MLTYQTYKLLKSLRTFKVPYIYESLDDNLEYRIIEKEELNLKGSDLIFSYNKDNFIIAQVDEINYLESESYITIHERNINFTHKGYRYFQISLIDFGKFLGKSVITPIVVAFITAYLTVLFFK